MNESINTLKKYIDNKKLVVFVGAGVSRNYGYPDWNELTTVILTEMNKTLENKIKIKPEYTSDEYLLSIILTNTRHNH